MPRSSSPVQIFRVVKSADNRFEKKDYKKALEGYKRALKMGPNEDIESFCYLKIGICYQYLQKYKECVASFDKSISIKKYFDAFFYKGLILIQLNKFDEAEDAFKNCLKLKELTKSQQFLSNLNLGRTSFLRGKLKNSIKFLKIANNLNDRDVTPLLLMAEAYKKMNNYENSLKTYEHVLKINLNNKDALMGIVGIFLEKGEEQKAISYLTGYLKQIKNPDPDLYVIKGDIHFSLSDFENALINFKKARKIKKASENLLIRETRCLLKLDKYSEAIEVINNFLDHKNNKDNFVANLFLAEVFATNKDYERASTILNKLLLLEDIIQKADLSQAVANILLLNNEYDRAEELFLNSVKLGLKSWTIMKQLALISIEKKNFDKANDFLEKSFQLAENFNEMGQSYHLKAIMNFNQAKYKEVIKISETGIKEIKIKNEHFILLQLLKAKSLLRLNEELKAKNLLNSMIKENSEIKLVIEQDSDLKELI